MMYSSVTNIDYGIQLTSMYSSVTNIDSEKSAHLMLSVSQYWFKNLIQCIIIHVYF